MIKISIIFPSFNGKEVTYDNVDSEFVNGIELLSKNKNLRFKLQTNLLHKVMNLNNKKIEDQFIKLYKSISKIKNLR